MELDTETLGGAAIWLVMMVLLGLAFYRAKTRRRHIGSGAAGAVYGMMSEEKRKAVEIVVSDKAAAHDFEHADDDNDKQNQNSRPVSP
jgi:uncharacterized membrane protein